MNEAQALQILDSIAAQTQMNRESHNASLQAVQTLSKALQELAGLRREIGALRGGDDEANRRIVDAASDSLPAE